MSKKGPQFLRFIIPIIKVLREMGDVGKSSEVIDNVIEFLEINESEQQETLKNGTSKVRNQVGWAKFYLVKAGFLKSSQRGVWELTQTGKTENLDTLNVIKLFKEVHSRFEVTNKQNSQNNLLLDSDENTFSSQAEKFGNLSYSEQLLNILQNLSPKGFEHICQLMLRKAGFEKVVITGQSNDKGIDGHGVLQLNPFVSFKAIFQCKRYQGAVPSSTVRDFRGAMQGRAEKGIIMTTGTFTTEAQKEAVRDGVTAIELIDGEDLVKLFVDFKLGVIPKEDYDIDLEFFAQYQ